MVLGQVFLIPISNADIWNAFAPMFIDFGDITCVSKTYRITIIPGLHNVALSALHSGNKTK